MAKVDTDRVKMPSISSDFEVRRNRPYSSSGLWLTQAALPHVHRVETRMANEPHPYPQDQGLRDKQTQMGSLVQSLYTHYPLPETRYPQHCDRCDRTKWLATQSYGRSSESDSEVDSVSMMPSINLAHHNLFLPRVDLLLVNVGRDLLRGVVSSCNDATCRELQRRLETQHMTADAWRQ